MARVYVNLLYASKRVWAQIPKNLKEEVKSLLIEDVNKGVTSPELYEAITGESYTK